MEITTPLFLTPNRELRYPIIGVFYGRVTAGIKRGKNETFLFSNIGRKEGRPDWRWAVRIFYQDIPYIVEQSMGIIGASS